MCCFSCCHTIFKVLSWRYWMHLSLSSIPHNTVHFISILRWSLFSLFISSWISKNYFLSLLLLFDHVFSHSMNFWKIDHSLPVSKMRNSPLPPLLVPLWVIDYRFELVCTHKDVDDGREFFNFFLLITNRIQKFFLLLLMLILNIFKFNKISSILFLYLLKSGSHLIHLLIQILVILFNI
jgi:hypothetical protein